jgi:hypothetical protein
VFQRTAMDTVFGPKREEKTGDWRKLRIDELHALHFLPNIVQMIT